MLSPTYEYDPRDVRYVARNNGMSTSVSNQVPTAVRNGNGPVNAIGFRHSNTLSKLTAEASTQSAFPLGLLKVSAFPALLFKTSARAPCPPHKFEVHLKPPWHLMSAGRFMASWTLVCFTILL